MAKLERLPGMRPLTRLVISTLVGDDLQYNVYTAELTAIHIALSQWKSSISQYLTCRIYADAQNAAKSIVNPQKQSGQSFIKPILDLIDSLVQPSTHRKLEIVWIPGHHGIVGNEQADENAKKAASDAAISTKTFHSPLKSCRTQQIKKLSKLQAKKRWESNKSFSKHLRLVLTNDKANRGPKLYNALPNRISAATIVQLRTGHCGLNKCLHRFGIRNSPNCECGYGRKETVEHYIFECPKCKDERKVLRRKGGHRKMRMRWLLADENLIKHTLDFVKSTGRLKLIIF